MKIGEFAQRYNMNQSAVRYYIEKALLTPVRKNGQYIFDKTCTEQMEKILFYKSLGFSLDEMGTIVCYEDASHLKDKTVLLRLLDLMQKKKQDVQRVIVAQERISERLETEIGKYEELLQNWEQGSDLPGMPLQALEILRCPKCVKSIELRNALISGAGIQTAKIRCECGYQAAIEDGVFIGEGSTKASPVKTSENIDSVSAITEDFSLEYANLVNKGHLWLYQKFSQQMENLRYVMAGPFTYNFMLKYLKKLPKDVIYILMDVSIDKVRKLQQCFSELDYQIVYIAAGSDMIPLREQSVDYYIDDFSTINHMLSYGKDLMKSVGPLISKHGRIICILNDYREAGGSLENMKKEYNTFEPEEIQLKKLYQNLMRSGVQVSERDSLGISGGSEKAFRQQAENETVSLIAYMAEKEQ